MSLTQRQINALVMGLAWRQLSETGRSIGCERPASAWLPRNRSGSAKSGSSRGALQSEGRSTALGARLQCRRFRVDSQAMSIERRETCSKESVGAASAVRGPAGRGGEARCSGRGDAPPRPRQAPASRHQGCTRAGMCEAQGLIDGGTAACHANRTVPTGVCCRPGSTWSARQLHCARLGWWREGSEARWPSRRATACRGSHALRYDGAVWTQPRGSRRVRSPVRCC